LGVRLLWQIFSDAFCLRMTLPLTLNPGLNFALAHVENQSQRYCGLMVEAF